MFILPKKLDFHDKIVVEGVTFDQRRQLKIGLLTGYDNADPYNAACQLDIDFNNKIAIQVIQNGQINVVTDEFNARDFFSGKRNSFATNQYAHSEDSSRLTVPDNGEYTNTKNPQSFHVTFKVRTEEIIDVYVETSFMANVGLKHNIEDIRFLNVQGDVEKVSRLDFQFG